MTCKTDIKCYNAVSRKDLTSILAGSTNGLAAIAISDYLDSAGCKSYVVESSYLDKDFTCEFAVFYAKTFNAYSKVCRRIHFFSEDVSTGLSASDALAVANYLKGISGRGHYLGFCVVRPLEHAPIGRTILKIPERRKSGDPIVTVKAKFTATLLGAELEVAGAPFIQQDTRVGACAQASLWVAGRHFHHKHRDGWYSIPDITRFATEAMDKSLSWELPAGSGGLHADSMARALAAMKYQPLMYTALNEGGRGKPKWEENLSPEDIICRYVDSGIPVILGLFDQEEIGHAVTVVGYRLRRVPKNLASAYGLSHGVCCKSFIVQDDARGPYREINVRGGGGDWTINGNVFFIIIPVPDRVYLRAEVAELIVRPTLSGFSSDWTWFSGELAKNAPNSVPYGQQLVDAINNNDVVLRTYLATGARYKQRLVAGNLHNDIKNIIVRHKLPRLVWVVEYCAKQSLNTTVPGKRLVLGHTLLDATSSRYEEARLLMHFPGYLQIIDNMPDDRNKRRGVQAYFIDDDRPYLTRNRKQQSRSQDA